MVGINIQKGFGNSSRRCEPWTVYLLDGDNNDRDHSWTYSVARAIKVTAWQSVDAFCHCCLTNGSCYWTQISCCLNEEKGYLLPTLARKITLPTFRLNAPVIIRAKVKKVRTNITIYSHTLLRIHVIGGQRSVRIAPPFLQKPTEKSLKALAAWFTVPVTGLRPLLATVMGATGSACQ